MPGDFEDPLDIASLYRQCTCVHQWMALEHVFLPNIRIQYQLDGTLDVIDDGQKAHRTGLNPEISLETPFRSKAEIRDTQFG